MKLFDGEPIPLLVRLMSGLMSIPASNADSERGFSCLEKFISDTVNNKFNSGECCHDLIFSEELPKKQLYCIIKK